MAASRIQFNVRKAVQGAHHLLKPGGLLLATVAYIRPLGNVVCLFLPQAVTRGALDDILDRFAGTLGKVLR